MRTLLSVLAFAFAFAAVVPPSPSVVPAALAAKKKPKKKPKHDEPKPPKDEETKPGATPEAPPAEASPQVLSAPLSAEPPPTEPKNTRGKGQVSRWSNAGAQVPVESPVEITAPLPERAVPKPVGVETPGQRLVEPSDERISAHFALYGSHLETVRQDDADTDLYRARATLAYEAIADSDFGAHLDVEYRARSSGTRPTDRRVNAAYVSYGLTDFVNRGGSRFGAALGRVAIPEAGYAGADGAAIRLRLADDLHVGGFGGVAGNPYNYNHRLHKTEDFGADWLTGGAFGALRARDFFVELAGVASIANVGKTGPDRIHAFLDAGWMPSDDLDVFLTGWIDVLPSGQPTQNVELVGTYSASDAANLRLALGRFSTLAFEASSLWSWRIDPASNTIVYVNPVDASQASGPAVDENGVPIQAYDQTYQLAIYNRAELRGGFRFDFGLEPYVSVEALLRDASRSPQTPRGLRLEPSAGAIYRSPRWVDLSLRFTAIIDPEARAALIVEGGLSRSIYGLELALDARHIAGEVPSTDGGVALGYVLPIDEVPGRLMLRAMFRYFRENVALVRPIDLDLLNDDIVLPLIPLQESFFGHAGVDWRF
ncbi:MAG: hypothetical protein HYV07_11560 [Deltaproteobacteria bacterium]|nr:hypothetical protein [Deltaproteobacteria bacterium]